ncbi:hypothetical protein EK21DRAFT_69002 [Setomelanomma holmii]|uniref:Uncharacterized protein n=1 Tax=Setomelanomma holmii TaxID=210430 RepID=A0A9P4H8Y6_9PLEO|nr:hypothetical protein EK21DRAFT_69002 [Setomelanomma holmii]
MFRNLATVSSRTCRIQARGFTISTARPIDTNPGSKTKKHATDKAKDGDTANIQESNAKAGMDANKGGTGGSATERKDSAGGAAKAKKDFPEAPDTIGMQDERGGRGG